MHDAGSVWVIGVISDVTLTNYVAWRSNLGLKAFSTSQVLIHLQEVASPDKTPRCFRFLQCPDLGLKLCVLILQLFDFVLVV